MAAQESWSRMLLGGAVLQTIEQATGAMQGKVIAVSGGNATVTLDDFGDNVKFSPCPYGRTSTPPQVGDVALVVFVGQGIDKPWLIRWAAPS